MANYLRDRVAAQRNDGPADNREQQQLEHSKTLAQQIKAMTPDFQLAMPKGAEATQLVRDALTCMRNTRDLAKCDAQSVLGALMTIAQLGLRPAVLGHAWPLPYWDRHANDGKGGYRAQVIIGYQGYIDLAYRSDRVRSIVARTVYERDSFHIAYYADADELIHRPYTDGPRGEATKYYAVARLNGDAYILTDPMSRQEMEAHRDKYAPRNKQKEIVGPWVNHFGAMALKTMILRLKTMPRSTEMATALAVDNGVRLDLNPRTDAAEVTERTTIPGELEPDDLGTDSPDALPPEPEPGGDPDA